MDFARESIVVLARALDASTTSLLAVARDEPLELFEKRMQERLELMRRLEAQLRSRPLPAEARGVVERVLTDHARLIARLQGECQDLLHELHLAEESRRNLASLSDGYADTGPSANLSLTA